MKPLLRTGLVLGVVTVLAAAVVRLHSDPVGFPENPPPIRVAELIPVDAPSQTVTLPDDWRAHPDFDRATYRITIDTPESVDVAWSLYLPRSSPLAAVRVSGVELPIRSAGLYLSGDLSYRLLPRLIRVPLDLLQQAPIVVELELAAPAGMGYMGPVWLGPSSVLDPAYAQRSLWRVAIWRLIAISLFAFSVGLGAAWFLRREDSVALWLSVFIFTTAASVWNSVTFDLPVPHPPTTHVGNGMLLAILVVLVHRLHDRHHPRIELAFFLFGAFAFATRIFIPPGPMQVAIRPPLFALMILGGIYPLGIVIREQLRGRRPEQEFISTAILIFMAAGVHDLLVLGGVLPRSHDAIALPATGLSASLFAWIFVRRYIGALETSEQLTNTLEERVSDRERELAENYQRLAAFERERAIEHERARMIEELHDGTGGQIVSALAMLDDPETRRAAVSEGLRTALEDMRLVLYSLDHSSADLGTLLGLLRDQLERPIHAAGLRLRWEVDRVEDPAGYSPEVALDIARIIQAAVANAIEHGQAQEITLRTHLEEGGELVIAIEDDGVGLAQSIEEHTRSDREDRGRGLVHMRRRAERIGGQIKIRARSPGTAIELHLAKGPHITEVGS